MGKTTNNEINETTEIVEGTIDEESMVVKFNVPCTFENETHEELDMKGLHGIKAKDMISAQKQLDRSGYVGIMPEMSMQYAMIIASKATGLPIEFFEELPPREAIKIKNKIISFFYGQD